MIDLNPYMCIEAQPLRSSAMELAHVSSGVQFKRYNERAEPDLDSVSSANDSNTLPVVTILRMSRLLCASSSTDISCRSLR